MSHIGRILLTDYHPTSRRPIAGVFRATARRPVAWCVRRGVHPDLISYSSIVASALAGLCFVLSAKHPWLLLIGPVLCYVRLWLNMLDGMVAVAGAKASSRGEILNDLPDRLSDVLIFASLSHSGWCFPTLGYWAAIFALLTAYVGISGQAVGVQREFSGVMSKPWRMVAVNVGAWLTFALICLRGGNVHLGPLTALDWALIVVIAGCLQTITIRLRRIFAALEQKDAAERGGP